jgi:hypothetical protein
VFLPACPASFWLLHMFIISLTGKTGKQKTQAGLTVEYQAAFVR